MAQNIAPIPDSTFLKCLNLTLDYYSAKHNNNLSDENHNTTVFAHCFVANIALIFSSRPDKIKQHDEQTYNRLINLLFTKNWSSLQFTSPSTLHLLHDSLTAKQLGPQT